MALSTPKQVLLTVLVVAVAAAAVVGPAAGAAASSDATSQGDCEFPVEYEDASGTTVTIEEKPERIVTTAPSAAQTLYEIGAWDRVVGVSPSANFLDGFEDREVVLKDDGVTVDVEKVVELDPDLVVAPDITYEEDVQKMRDAGLTVVYFEEAGDVEGVKEQTRRLGEFVGECEGADETVEWMNEELETVRDAVSGEEPVRALYVYSPDFGPYTAGEGTFIADAIELAGAVNVAGEAGIEGHKAISDEVVVEQDPGWLIVNSFDGEPPQNDVYNGTTAVQEDNVVVVDVNNLNQAAPRIVLAISEMAEAFHPDAYAEANATPTETPSQTGTPTVADTETPTPTEDDPATPSPTPTDAPGFGLAAALVALLATLVIARRR